MKALRYKWVDVTVTGHVGAYMQLYRGDLADEPTDLFPLPDWFLPQNPFNNDKECDDVLLDV